MEKAAGSGKEGSMDSKSQAQLHCLKEGVQRQRSFSVTGAHKQDLDNYIMHRRRRASEGSCHKRNKRRRRPQQVVRNATCAPFNNNEFLMEEHKCLVDEASSSLASDEEEFQCRDFLHTFNDIVAERLHDMTRAQLIRENEILEERLDDAHNVIKQLKCEKHRWSMVEQENSELQAEVQRLREMLEMQDGQLGVERVDSEGSMEGETDECMEVSGQLPNIIRFHPDPLNLRSASSDQANEVHATANWMQVELKCRD